jgi:CheY-like chemotaxis protein
VSDTAQTTQQGLLSLNRRVLVIDDNPAIHADFRKVLNPSPVEGGELLDMLEAEVLGAPAQVACPQFELEVAFQGEEGVQKAKAALQNGRPYALAFVDMRMPPGVDGLNTIKMLWSVDAAIQVVICSAHADYEWSEVVARLNFPDQLLC